MRATSFTCNSQPTAAAYFFSVRSLLQGRLPALPNIGFGIVDVRDVAELHWRALTAPREAILATARDLMRQGLIR